MIENELVDQLMTIRNLIIQCLSEKGYQITDHGLDLVDNIAEIGLDCAGNRIEIQIKAP